MVFLLHDAIESCGNFELAPINDLMPRDYVPKKSIIECSHCIFVNYTGLSLLMPKYCFQDIFLLYRKCQRKRKRLTFFRNSKRCQKTIGMCLCQYISLPRQFGLEVFTLCANLVSTLQHFCSGLVCPKHMQKNYQIQKWDTRPQPMLVIKSQHRLGNKSTVSQSEQK